MEKYFELKNGGIEWTVKSGARHRDNLEMSGLAASVIVSYGADETKRLFLSRHCVFPTLRTIPNDTHASFQLDIEPEKIPPIYFDGKIFPEYAKRFFIDGVLTCVSSTEKGIFIERCFYPASDSRCAIERVSLINHSGSPVSVEIPRPNTVVDSYGRGTKGVYIVEVSHDFKNTARLEPGEKSVFHIFYTARTANEPLALPDGENELFLRRTRIRQLVEPLTLDTGDAVLDTMFRFAKIRAGESIFKTWGGLMHSPGGQAYYAATWCNDQAEYAGPWFAFTGDAISLEAGMNAYRQYMPFMADQFTRIPSSVIAEGSDIWEGAGDRGDAAMYLYGASMFALCSGRPEFAKELWPAVLWCAEYCERKKSEEGVIQSDSDELEGRFPTDKKANLSTSSLCCGGLKLASVLAGELGQTSWSREYEKRATSLETAIERYFGAQLHGFETYRYSKGFDTLRAWICLPLCMGIRTRLSGTLGALFSDYLWTEDGLLSCERGKENCCDTVWDRSTLFAFRSAFLAGKGDEIWDYLRLYCNKRLLGDRVPYAVEAYPEGDRRHLSAESALFCRIITEGLLGIVPKGLRQFAFTPKLPSALDHISLTNIHAFGRVFDLYVDKNGYRVSSDGKEIACGKNGREVTILF